MGRCLARFRAKTVGTLYAAVRYPGRVPHLVSISLEDGAVTELQEIGEAMQYRVASVALDPEAGTLFYTTDHMGYRNLMAYDLKSGKARMLLEEQRIGDLAFNRADRSLWGLRTNNGYVILVRIPHPYKEWQRVHAFPYGEVAFDLDVSPDGALVSTSVAGLDSSRAGAQVMQVRVMKTEALLAGDATPVRTLDIRQLGAGGLRVLAGRQVPLRQLLLHGRVEHLSLRDRNGGGRGGQQRRGRVLPPGAAPRRRAADIQLHRSGLPPSDDPTRTRPKI